MKTPVRHALVLTLTLALMTAHPCAGQTLETETARLLPHGTAEGGAGFEIQTSGEGVESAIPLVINYGATDNLEIVVEPVPYTSIRPKVGPHALGSGDLEVTLQYRPYNNVRSGLALALGAEVKVPTARNDLIGTGATDYTGYLIASKRFGPLDVHANLGYTLVGQPSGLDVTLNNIVSFAAAAEVHPTSRTELFAEVLGSTAALPEGTGEGEGTTVIPEISGGELVGTLGAGYTIVPGVLAFFSASLDNNRAVLLHPGLTIRLR